MQSAAWDLASPWVQQHVSLMVALPPYRQSLLESSARFPLSLADGIVLVHRLGLSSAAKIVLSVDPWCYPGEQTPAAVAVKGSLQGATDKAKREGDIFYQWTPESRTGYLLSPLLLPKGKRPSLVRNAPN